MKKLIGFLFAFVLCAMLTLAGCSSSSSHNPSTVKGIASSGAAISGTVTLKDAKGEELGPEDIGADGSFTFVVDGLTPPFVIKATSGAESWYSYAAGPGTANVNPLTMLALAMAMESSGNPEDAYADPSEVSDDAITSAIDKVQAFFANIFEGFGLDQDFNPFTGDCTVNHDGIDALFDALDFTVDAGNLKVTKRADGSVIGETPIAGIDPDTPLEDNVTTDLLWGTYNYCYLYFNTPEGGNESYAGAGYMTFMTDNTWTSVEEISLPEEGEEEDGEEEGEYARDSAGVITLDGNSFEPGYMTLDREIIVVPKISYDDNDVGISILCKRDTSLTAADISGTYLLMVLGRITVDGTAYAESEIGKITFNGSGRYTAEDESGTYAVNASTGRITVNSSIGAMYGMVAKGGDVIVVVAAYDDDESDDPEVQINVLVRTSSKEGWNKSSLDGEYYLSELYSHMEVAPDAEKISVHTAITKLTMTDGEAGGWFYKSGWDEGEELDPSSYETSTYHDEGELTFNHFVIDSELLGIASPDGEFLAIMSEEDEPDGAGIILGVKGVFEVD
jgi:hypothetical protein